MENNSEPRSDIQFWTILKFGFALLMIAVLVHVGMWWMFNLINQYEIRNEPKRSPMAPAGAAEPPEPRLQVTPVEDLAKVNATEDEILNTYGWVDQNAGVVRIPISEAMKLVVTKQLTQPQTQTQAQTQTQTTESK